MSKMTLLDFLIEAKVGNYASINTKLPESIIEFMDSVPTSVPRIPDEKLHATLIYSIGTTVDEQTIHKVLDKGEQSFSGKIHSLTKFDALPKDGERDSGLCTIVMEVTSPELVNLHNRLKKIGLKHSYDEFRPHVSLYYDIPREEGEKLIQKLEPVCINKTVTFSGFNVEPLK
jgi:2'-5' RNA ligase